MTYLVVLPEKSEDRPQWFKDKYLAIMSDGILFIDNFRDKPWTWYWNEKYEHKVRIRQGRINIEFESEEMYTWFILKEL